MRADPIDRDASDASVNVGDCRSGGDATTDFSDELGSIPSKLSFHGLAQTQTQSQGAWLAQTASSGGPESQKENRQLLAPSESSSLLIPGTTVSRFGNVSKSTGDASHCKAIPPSHVTMHVTGASPRVDTPFAGPIDASATASSNSVPLMKNNGPDIRASPIRPKTKAVSFFSPKSIPSPPTLPRTNTMPPRLNRYAPRNIDRSSQDSFAGPLPPQDLNAYVRNSRIFNNTYIRRGRDGRPGEVFEHPAHLSTTTSSLSELPIVNENMSSQSEQEDDRPSVSQVLRAAFDPRSLSPIPAPEPVILVRDSQSQQSRDGKREGSDGGDNGGKAQGSEGLSSLADSPHLHPQTPSSSGSYELPEEVVADSAESNTQSTQPNTQSTQAEPQQPDMIVPPSMSTNLDGRSPLPVPLHRQRQVAALHKARLRATEVVPETPASTVGPSMQPSIPPVSSNTPAVTDAPTIPPPQSGDVHLDHVRKGGVSEVRDIRTKSVF